MENSCSFTRTDFLPLLLFLLLLLVFRSSFASSFLLLLLLLPHHPTSHHTQTNQPNPPTDTHTHSSDGYTTDEELLGVLSEARTNQRPIKRGRFTSHRRSSSRSPASSSQPRRRHIPTHPPFFPPRPPPIASCHQGSPFCIPISHFRFPFPILPFPFCLLAFPILFCCILLPPLPPPFPPFPCVGRRRRRTRWGSFHAGRTTGVVTFVPRYTLYCRAALYPYVQYHTVLYLYTRWG